MPLPIEAWCFLDLPLEIDFLQIVLIWKNRKKLFGKDQQLANWTMCRSIKRKPPTQCLDQILIFPLKERCLHQISPLTNCFWCNLKALSPLPLLKVLLAGSVCPASCHYCFTCHLPHNFFPCPLKKLLPFLQYYISRISDNKKNQLISYFFLSWTWMAVHWKAKLLFFLVAF